MSALTALQNFTRAVPPPWLPPPPEAGAPPLPPDAVIPFMPGVDIGLMPPEDPPAPAPGLDGTSASWPQPVRAAAASRTSTARFRAHCIFIT